MVDSFDRGKLRVNTIMIAVQIGMFSCPLGPASVCLPVAVLSQACVVKPRVSSLPLKSTLLLTLLCTCLTSFLG